MLTKPRGYRGVHRVGAPLRPPPSPAADPWALAPVVWLPREAVALYARTEVILLAPAGA
jgi:hypothetical protein